MSLRINLGFRELVWLTLMVQFSVVLFGGDYKFFQFTLWWPSKGRTKRGMSSFVYHIPIKLR